MKKLSLLLPLFASVFLVGCGTTTQVPPTPVVEDTENLGMTIHMCLMGGGENCDEYLNPANKEKYGTLVLEQCTMMPGMEACDVYFGE